MQNTTLVVPCYNEATRLRPEEFLRVIREDPGLAVIFVNDGSTDDTASVLRGLCQKAPDRLSQVDLERNSGKAEAVRKGVLRALETDASLIGYWDADLATPFDELPTLTAALRRPGKEIVLASRVRLLGRKIERNPLRHYLGRIFATLASFVLRVPVYDTQCGAKLFLRTEALARVFSRPFLSRWIFDVEILERLAACSGGPAALLDKVVEVPLATWHDVPGSKLRTWSVVRAGLELLRLAWRMRADRAKRIDAGG